MSIPAPTTTLDATTRRAVADTVPVPHGMPSQPFDRTRLALWRCTCGPYGAWNDPARTHCRTCGEVRHAD